jgi:prolyl-tRNA synthetase
MRYTRRMQENGKEKKDKRKTITPQSEDFALWYQDVVREAELAESSDVRGCGIVRPYGYKIWELIKSGLARRIEEKGVENVYFPLFVPVENIEQEQEHVEGFAPELAVVTHAGGEKLTNSLAVRPTSEAAMYTTYGKWIQSYKDLPLELNQWNNVVRWEKRPRAFLRWSEFLWQEGHSAFATAEEARADVRDKLAMYEEMYEYMAVPVFTGRKSEKEKFAGAEMTTTAEAMARDGKAIQGATSHYLGTHFAKVFNVSYLGEDNESHLCHQTSWGFSWRSVGVAIMVHGDDKGLRLPPSIAPVQVVIIPIYKEESKGKVLAYAEKLYRDLRFTYRVKLDTREHFSPGFKFNHWEVRGVPLRLEVGDREVEEQTVTIARRDTGEKSIEKNGSELPLRIGELCENVHQTLYTQATDFYQKHIHRIETIDDIGEQTGFFEASWSETSASEKILKEKYGMVSRVLPQEFAEKKPKNKKCFITGEPAQHDWYFAKSY